MNFKRRDGQALVEFSMVLLVLIPILLGILGFGLLFSAKHVLDNAAREAARQGAVGKSYAEVQAVVAQRTDVLPQAATVSITLTSLGADGVTVLGPDQRQRGGSVTVALDYNAQTIGIPGILPITKHLVAQSTFRTEVDK